MTSSVAYGKTDDAKYFVFHRRQELFEAIENIALLNAKLRDFGIFTYAAQPVEEFYSKGRHTGDLIIFILVLVFPMVHLLLFFRKCLMHKN